MTYELCRKRITLAGLRLANYVVDLYKHDTRRDKMQLREERPAGKWFQFKERSMTDWQKILAKDSLKAQKEFNLAKLIRKTTIESQ